MKRIVWLVVCSIIVASAVQAQTISNAGNEFWIVFPSHSPDVDQQFNPLLANLNVFLTGLQASSGTITAGNFSMKFQTTPGHVTEVLVPRSACYINETDAGKVLPGKAIHITVDDGKPNVVAYAHIYAGQRSEASLILPKEALGQQYYSINYQEYEREGKNYITLVASEPDTRIHIKRGNTELVPGGVTLTNVNDVYEYLSYDDLTGVSVAVDSITSGCKHFAVFTGSTGVYIPTKNCTPHSIDPLFQQCYPIESWGTDFGFIPFSTNSPGFPNPVRQTGQFVRILAKDDNTLVKIDGNVVANLKSGEYFTTDTPLAKPSFINCSKPVCVAQYAITQSCSNQTSGKANTSSGYSDPDMVILNPIQFDIRDITLYSSNKQDIKEQYVNILLKTAAIPSLLVNNKPPDGIFQPFGVSPGFSYIQLPLKDSTNTFHITASDGFSAIAYGFGNVESYAYSAGTNLASRRAISGIKTATGLKVDSACLADDYSFRLVLPYKSSQLSWKMDDNEDAAVQFNPTVLVVNEDGRESYAYSFPKTPAYQITGIHHIKVIAVFSKTIGGCVNSQEEIDYNFKVIKPPVAAFHFTRAKCGGTVYFSSDSKDDVNGIIGWKWDFGDPDVPLPADTSTRQNSAHDYKKGGKYAVKLTVISAAGCESTITDTVLITRPLVEFTAVKAACVERQVTFKATSAPENFKRAQRIWSFGDGTAKTTPDTSVVHAYKKAGRYPVTLTLLSDSGCTTDTVTKIIDIYNKPSPDFISPAICQSDGIAHFSDKSVFPEGDLQFTYRWQFDDKNSSPGNPDTSGDRSPTHRFTAAGIYHVRLTVASSAGCDTSVSKDFVINGTMPKSAFHVAGGSRFCSSEPAIFINNSKMLDYGSIIRLEWYFDAINHPTEKVVIDSPAMGNTYIHQYKRFHRQPDSVKYVVKLIAYSGTACADSSFSTVTVLPMPDLKFDTIKTTCVNAKAFQLTEAAETSGIEGDGGAFSGLGVSPGGMFDPAIAGTGIHEIKYRFTSAAGCADSTSQWVQVISLPAVSAGSDRVILQGERVTLKPTVTDSQLAYKWSPATGLSRDDIPDPVAKPDATQVYTLVVSGGDCQETSSVKVSVLKPIHVYNTFTPNGDGINDVWDIPQLNDYPGATVDIFNRYGTSVYHSVGYAKPWDGKYHSDNVPTGTYYYLIAPKNGAKVLSGYVTVIR